MNAEERAKVYYEALERYGIERQEWMLVEEIGELLQALNKRKRARALEPNSHESRTADDALLSELADTAIMLEQVTLAMGFTMDHLAAWKDTKIGRLQKRMEAAG